MHDPDLVRAVERAILREMDIDPDIAEGMGCYPKWATAVATAALDAAEEFRKRLPGANLDSREEP